MKQLFTFGVLFFLSFAFSQSIDLVKDIFPGAEGSGIMQPVVFNGKLYFYADDGVHGGELWSSDGTETGTQLVKDINPEGNSEVGEITVLNGRIVFLAADANGYELWSSDGTAAGTSMVMDIQPGSAGSIPSGFTVIGNQAFFQAIDGPGGYELWATDGTANGTFMVKNINPSGDSYPSQLTAYDGKLIFSAYTFETGNELWISDGTEAGTMLLKDIFADGNGDPRLFHEFNGLLFFRADDENGDELWVTDGTSNGTYRVKDINPAQGDGSSIGEFTEANGQLFFRARTATEGFELWKTDGTAEGTVMVKDIWPGGDSFPGELTAYEGKLYFQATDGSAANTELWVSDETSSETFMLKDIHPTNYSAPNEFIVFNGLLYFVAEDGTNGREFWVTDGTVAGTQKLLSDVEGVSPMYFIPFYVIYVNRLYFKAEYGNTGAELHKFTPANLASAGVRKDNFRVYPNPASTIVSVDAASGNSVKEIVVFATTGQEIARSDSGKIDVLGLSAGLYLMRVTGFDGTSSVFKVNKI
ncbi:ELWxxDGT repeat protein [Flavobacterium selenitireducens]|uniref:ELWxxDGT repeat protein n=1 Tax=Flavobacterium selenitireducens TaxID=2722704 RepID=UPI00168AEFBB|nr:ELWxxDGT repeat protein [Flavobacterium selenitireducens]MBD3582276.1 T9SS type A sorting domain-containing protein [Flavobacterium selenitireducens]